ncbi:AAA family ATPase [Sediminibacterium sp. C3]|uniref:AAA family ATPase n=1 Tax=Sediminibacterium sp. C3 TaxID=1267211 RepID=UPI000415CDDE|nr:AAA family ATPase [Sediminibacterium sp. C3]
MSTYIQTAQVRLYDNLDVEFTFLPHLNIISGENGTMKTKVLHSISQRIVNQNNQMGNPASYMGQQNEGVQLKYSNQGNLKVFAISPKRNTERKNIDAIVQQLKSSPMAGNFNNEMLHSLIEDQTFRNYPSFAELFYKYLEDKNNEGNKSGSENMIQIAEEYNQVIKKVFSNYTLETEWNKNKGRAEIIINKNNIVKLGPESLSLGEQEILSIIINLYYNKDKNDVFLIDEPETHLNWHLEEKLFSFLDWFSSCYSKQLIIVTHSRAIFNSHYLKATKFLAWGDDGKIHLYKELSKETKKESQVKQLKS